jgi:hypothetical protein
VYVTWTLTMHHLFVLEQRLQLDEQSGVVPGQVVETLRLSGFTPVEVLKRCCRCWDRLRPVRKARYSP